MGIRIQGSGEQLLEEMCSGSEAGSYIRLIDFLHHSTLDLRVIKKKRSSGVEPQSNSTIFFHSRVLSEKNDRVQVRVHKLEYRWGVRGYT